MPSAAPTWPTIGAISRLTGIPTHRLRYAASKRNVKPVGRAGGVLVFTNEDANYIVAEARRIEREREQRGGAFA